MAECTCGGATIERDATSKAKDLDLAFHECKSCGRIGGEKLTRRSTGGLIDTGPRARTAWQSDAPGEMQLDL